MTFGRLRILLIDPVYGRHTPFWFVPLGLGYIAAMLERQHGRECAIEIVRERDVVLDKLRSEKYAVIAATNYVWNTRLSNAYLAAAKALQPDAITIQGGPQFQQAEPAVAAAYLTGHPAIDYYVYGEGEATMAALVQRLAGGGDLFAPEPGVAFVREGAYHDGGTRRRISDLDDIPSPYLGGWLDPFLAQGYGPLLETNRGCPFSCTYCNWGSATLAKVNRFSMDRVTAELEYIAAKACGTDHLTIADANFGILPRDLEIATTIERLWRSRGYPANIHLWYTKNSSKKTIDIARVLGRKVRFLLAMQSMNAQVLANIKRDNIRLDVFRDLAAYARSKGLMTASDLIVGLPGEDLASLKDSLEQLFQFGVDKVDLFNLLLIPGTDLYSQATRERFGIRTMHRLADGCVIALGDEVVAETEEVVIATDALAFDDYLTIGKYQALSIFWHHCGIGDPFTNYARRCGIPESRLFFSILDEHRQGSPIAQALSFLEARLRSELHASPGGVEQAAARRLDEGPQLTRVAFAFTRHVIAHELGGHFFNAFACALERELRAAAGGALATERAAELDNLRRFTRAFQYATDTGAVTMVALDYAVGNWIEANYACELAELRLRRLSRFCLTRSPARMPKGPLGRINAARCDVREFNEWLYQMRNVRDFVVMRPVGEASSPQGQAFVA